jgi:SAM-dependent methyltransferase
LERAKNIRQVEEPRRIIRATEALVTKHKVCPWWIGYLLACPFRKFLQDPASILSPHVRPGMCVLEPGPGMGFFTIELARLVGPCGRVVVVDVQPKMIDGLKRRAEKAGLLDRIDARVASADSMGVSDLGGKIDFLFAFASVHEMPSLDLFFTEAAGTMKIGAALLLAEPAGHVSDEEFNEELAAAEAQGLKVKNRFSLSRCNAALLQKI